MSKTRRILVTGGTGLVGKAIEKVINEENSESTKLNNEEWYFVGSKECDLTDLDETSKLFQKYSPTDVINLAAMVGGLYCNLNNNLDFFLNNLAIAQNILKCCDKMNVNKCVSCLSTCIFPDKTKYPIDETMVHDGPPHDSNFGYAYAKRMIDVLNRAYAQDKGCRFTSVIPCNVFGPYDNYNLANAHVIPALIHKTYIAKTKNEPLIVYGSGKPLRQFIYSEDLARLFVWTLRHYNEVEPIILAGDDEIEIANVVAEIVKAFNFKGEIIFDKTKADGQYKKTASNQKLRNYLSDFKFTPFSIAMEKSVQWFINNYDTARK